MDIYCSGWVRIIQRTSSIPIVRFYHTYCTTYAFICQYFNDKIFKKKDVVNVSVDTTKENELFDYVGYERYYGVPKYNELDDDFDKDKEDDFDLSM